MPFYVRSILLAVACTLGGCGWTEPKNSVEDQQAERDTARTARLRATCSSKATYERLKQIVFDQAIRIRNEDPVNLDLLSTHSLARVEDPVVKSRDDALDVTVCSGRLVLHIPPGAEGAFDGKRELTADIEYAAQAAADGSGLVYRIAGAEPVINSLARFDLQGRAYRPAAEPTRMAADARPEPTTAPPPAPRPSATVIAEAAPRPSPTAARTQRPAPAPARTESRRAASPSFSCRAGQSRSERMVCSSEQLASLDRTMSSQFFSRLSRSDKATRAELRRTRDQFLARRERCGDEACVAQVYRDRMREIDAIAQ